MGHFIPRLYFPVLASSAIAPASALQPNPYIHVVVHCSILCIYAVVTTTTFSPGRSEERRVGKSVDLGGRRIIKKKSKEKY